MSLPHFSLFDLEYNFQFEWRNQLTHFDDSFVDVC